LRPQTNNGKSEYTDLYVKSILEEEFGILACLDAIKQVFDKHAEDCGVELPGMSLYL
jgi:hypothetical protein